MNFNFIDREILHYLERAKIIEKELNIKKKESNNSYIDRIIKIAKLIQERENKYE